MNCFLGIDATSGVLVADFEDTGDRRQPPGQRRHGRSAPTCGTTPRRPTTATDTWRLYLDGELDRTLALGGNFTPAPTSIQHAALGCALTSTGAAAGFFQGDIDEAAIWNVARSGAHIRPKNLPSAPAPA